MNYSSITVDNPLLNKQEKDNIAVDQVKLRLIFLQQAHPGYVLMIKAARWCLKKF